VQNKFVAEFSSKPDLGEAVGTCVSRSRIHDVDQLKSRLIEEWEHFHQVFVDEIIRQWRIHVFELAFEHTEYILNTDFSYV